MDDLDQLFHEEPPPHSAMAGDDLKTPYDSVSFQSHFYLSVAIEHLQAIQTFYRATERTLPPFSFYSLARASIESAAYGIWILSGNKRQKRVRRSLKITYDNSSDVATLACRLGVPYDLENVRKRLTEIQAMIPGNRQYRLSSRSTTITSMLSETDKIVDNSVMSGADAWRICSGITHANKSIASKVLETSKISGTETETSSSYLVTTSVTMIAAVVSAAIEYTDHLSELIVERSTPNSSEARS
ncbi:hypothetical protein [Paramicrobacterium agarici]|uniref:Uncharacterized protein n=1 Tax=Paramicrobacterium agarici TaxID=630514 RepID=A0A2A9DWX3_9MICO|nr:hypothetical protein [Microbacterium agarici]PFG31188.1 hypothetical protein ATJ78_2143 [Microbacterium agarici]